MNRFNQYPEIDTFMEPFYPYFHRSEGRELARCYIAGLTMDGDRKSVEPMSERVNASERSMQRLLTAVRWDEAGVLQEYRRHMLAKTGDPQAALLVTETIFPKKGADSVCVARQSSGLAAKMENCQIGIGLTYVGLGPAWPCALDLFLPQSWDIPVDESCRERRRKTHVPDSVRYREKWRIVIDQIDRMRSEGIPYRDIVAHNGYGDIAEFRQALSERNENYVVGISPETKIIPEGSSGCMQGDACVATALSSQPSVTVSEVGEKIGEKSWALLGLKSNDEKHPPFTVKAVSLMAQPLAGYRSNNQSKQVWLLIEKRGRKEKGADLRYYFSNRPLGRPALEAARLQQERLAAEHCRLALKARLGIAHHEGRSWTGWHRHVLLVFLAYSYLTSRSLIGKKQKQQETWASWMKERTMLGKELFI